MFEKLYLKQRALEEQEVRRNRSSTYTEPLDKAGDVTVFLSHFYKNVYNEQQKALYREKKEKFPVLKFHYEVLVPSIVSYEDFWQRYEYRCDVNRIIKDLRGTGYESQVANQLQRVRQSFKNIMNEESDLGKSSENLTQTTTPARKSLAASLGGMKDRLKTLIVEDMTVKDAVPKENIGEDTVDFESGSQEQHTNGDESEVVQELDDSDSDISTIDQVTNIHVYPDIIEMEGQEFDIDPNEIKQIEKIYVSDDDDSEYGSLDIKLVDEEFMESEFEQMGKVRVSSGKVDDTKTELLSDYYRDDTVNKDGSREDCECACIIS
jgi:hypothetical protein